MKSALFLSPEAPYPVVGGGAIRSASLLEYLAQRYTVDAIVFRQPGERDPSAAVPERKVRRVFVLDLPFHSKTPGARIARNGLRLVRGRPPLLDRFSGFGSQVKALLAGASYELCVVEHFWCAPYAHELRPFCRKLVLDLHNIESIWHARLAQCGGVASALAHKRFAAGYQALERKWLPQFDELLVTSGEDRKAAALAAPRARITVYPNALPEIPRIERAEEPVIIFTGNLEYEPNVSALRYFRSEIWPRLSADFPQLQWHIVGKNADAVSRMFDGDPGIRLVGPVDDAIAALRRAQVAVVPLLAGSGTRIKILEAWAAATPVVSTSIGAEGLDCTAGQHLVVADNAIDFSRSVAKLLASPSERAMIGEAGRHFYEQHFTWPAAWTMLHL